MTTLRIGLIGFGGSGQAHAFYWSCVAGCRVTKIFDPKPPAAARAAARAPDALFCADEERFWPDLDAVVVCTPDATHARYVVAALERGLHVLVEKPLTDSLEGLCAIRRAAAAAPAQVVAVVHQMRFVPLHRRMKALVERRRARRDLLPRGLLRARPDVARVRRPIGGAKPTTRRRSCTPAATSSTCCAGSPARRSSKCSRRPNHRAFPEYPESDLNVVTLRFASGAIGKVIVAFGEPGPQDHTVRVAGSEASVRGNLLYRRDGALGEVLHRPMVFQPPLLKGPGKTGGETRYRQLRTNLPPYLYARSVEALRLLARRPNAEYGAANYPVRLYEHSLACVGAIDDFVSAIRDRRPPLCSIEEAGRTVLACLAGVESYRTNTPVAVAEFDS